MMRLRLHGKNRVMKEFTNSARSDGLVLRHWERKGGAAEQLAYPFSRFNVKVDVPRYTDAEYEHLAEPDPEWTREETDYLFELCREYDLRFPIIWDRYEYPGGGTPPRSMEDIKARFYKVSRQLMELRTPVAQMTPEQTAHYNLLDFKKEQEVARKKMAERLFSRSSEEVREEQMLLTEFKRILTNQEAMYEERRDLFQRLNVPIQSGSIAAYQGSQGLTHLRDVLMASSDKSKKRKSIAMSGAAHGANGTGADHNGQQTPTGVSSGRDGPGPAAAAARRRQLTAEEEEAFGVTYPEKLTSGIKFRSAMVPTNPRGVTQQKSAQALAQLGISNKLTMPTARTLAKYEQLQAALANLLDTKKLLDKLEQEARVLKAQSEKE